MRTLPELLNSWLPAPDRPSVLVAAGEAASFAASVEKLQQAERPMEVVRVSSPADAQRLVRRGAVAILVVDASNTLPGNLELLLEAVSKEKPPQVLVVSPQARATSVARPVEAVAGGMDAAAWAKLAQECVRRFQTGKVCDLRAGDLLSALAVMPDEGWLRICSGDEFGDICVSQGKAIYCEVGRQAGDEAAAKICEWGNCLFEYRELPEFLRQNMDKPLGELGQGQQPAAAPTKAAPARSKEPDMEEPDQFPVLEEMLRAAPAIAAEATGEPGLEEPDDLPAFDPKAADAEIVVEEPQEFLLREDSEPVEEELEEPLGLDFDAPAAVFEPSVAMPAAPIPAPSPAHETASVFEAVAVLCMSRMIRCEPPNQARYFDPETLSVFYERSKAYIMRHQLGEAPLLQIGGGDFTILVVAAPGGDCLIAAKTSSGQISAEQKRELDRLCEEQAAASPAFSR
ncbi:MAG: DUF4388 domain-containing protein [Bryobacterales bacterium]|nr:DUF4388 domain-containing protein [Bryobacterales bacterium]